MGNRAIIKQAGKHTGVYLHWNGGRDSVEAFLEYCKLKGYSGFETDYGLARFCQVVGNWFGAGLSLGIIDNIYGTEDEAEGLDNGIYIVKGWEIVGRIPEKIREQNNYDRLEFLLSIDESQPVKEQLGEKFLKAEPTPTEEIKLGDIVFYQDELDGRIKEFEVAGFGEDRFVNGTNVLGMPYINRFSNDGDYSHNINNYLRNKSYRLLKGE